MLQIHELPVLRILAGIASVSFLLWLLIPRFRQQQRRSRRALVLEEDFIP